MRLLPFLMLLAVSPLTLPFEAVAETIIVRKAPSEKLDKLFAALKRSKSEVIANDLADEIKGEWLESGSANVDLMMQWAQAAMDENKNQAALDWLDQVVTLKPDYAEGWNRRATVHFLMSNYAKSMTDIEKTLELEPRHFGALSGMGMILMTYEKKELALKAYRKALDIHPMMRDVQQTVGGLEDELAGSRI